MRTRTLLATAGLAVAGFLAVAVVAGQGVASAGTGHTMILTEKFTHTVTQDIDPKGVSMGDRLEYTTDVRNREGRKVGLGVGDCVQLSGTSEADALYNCIATFRLGRDHIMSSGIWDLTRKTNKWAIMGGTGRYRGASGEIDFTAPTADSFVDTFRFDS